MSTILENQALRDAERKIRELLQKSLLAEARKEQINLTKETIDKYFKHSKYHKQKLQDDEVTIGMINGLAHTARGGDLIKIEASKYNGDGKIKATGKLGEVLKESIDAAMTGEITLKGRVLEIGGLKEKLTAAVREGIKEVIIPKNNERDLVDIPEEIKKALVIHPVTRTREILDIVFKTQISNTTVRH